MTDSRALSGNELGYRLTSFISSNWKPGQVEGMSATTESRDEAAPQVFEAIKKQDWQLANHLAAISPHKSCQLSFIKHTLGSHLAGYEILVDKNSQMALAV